MCWCKGIRKSQANKSERTGAGGCRPRDKDFKHIYEVIEESQQYCLCSEKGPKTMVITACKSNIM